MPVNRQNLCRDTRTTGNCMVEIKGLQKTTLLDYPGKLSCIIFLPGCNFRCPFCHNADLVLRKDELPTISEKEIFDFLNGRKGKLEGVVITGGEPTLQPDLPDFIKKIKDLGFLIKIDTNGTNPKMVNKLLKEKLLDYVAVDYKGPFNKYHEYIGQAPSSKLQAPIKQTIKLLLENGLDFELRTTVVPTLHSRKDLIDMAQQLNNLAIEQSNNIKWYLQPFKPTNCLDPQFRKIKPFKPNVIKRMFMEAKKHHKNLELRGF